MAPPHDTAPQTEDSSSLRTSSPRITNYEAIEDGKNPRDSPDNTLPTAPFERQNSENNNYYNDQPTNEYVLNVAFLSFVGFMLLQGFFAIIANSESMLADSEAMSVDAMTYLFNMWAERVKSRPPTQEELGLPLAVREHRIEMKRLYLELIPPLISVTTLIAVTISALKEAFRTIAKEDPDSEADVSAGLMLFFSGLNLLLDVVNVSCFARAQQAYGLQKPQNTATATSPTTFNSQRNSEQAVLLSSSDKNEDDYDNDDDEEEQYFDDIQGTDLTRTDHTTHDSLFEDIFGHVNLNMCSAWTHICADTLRSIAVLVAAFFAYVFDSISPAKADSAAAIAVSVTILVSLIPLLRGLFVTARQIIIESKNKPELYSSS